MSNFDGKCFNCGAYMENLGEGVWVCKCGDIHDEFARLPPEAFMEIVDEIESEEAPQTLQTQLLVKGIK